MLDCGDILSLKEQMHHLVFTTDCDDYGSWKQNCINYIVGKLYFLGQRYDPLHSLWDIQLMSVHLNNELNIHEVVYLKECQMASQEEQKDVVNLLLTFLVFFFPSSVSSWIKHSMSS